MDTNPIHYREEVLKQFFKHIKSGESFYIVGAPSVGKTRLMDFLMGYDPDAMRQSISPDQESNNESKHERVKKHYLSDVLAGYAGGLFWLTVCITALEAYRKKTGSQNTG